MSGSHALGRRELLSRSLGLVGLGAIGAAVTGCAPSEPEGVSLTADPARLDSLASELDLIVAYEQTIAARPDLAEPLTYIAEQHRLHAEQLSLGQPLALADRDVQAAGTVADLQERERQAAGLRAGACVRAVNTELAGVLCLIGASEAQHVVALAQLDDPQ